MSILNLIRVGLIVSVTLISSFATSYAAQQELIDPEDTYVLAIGSCPPWQELKGVCKNDVDLIISTAIETMGIPSANIKTVVDSEATYKGVEEGFKWLQDSASDSSSVIVYYNGHGMLLDNIEGKGKEEVFVLWSKEFPFAGLYAVMAKIWMTDKEFAALLNKVPGRAKLVIADTCHAGGAEEYLKYKGKRINYELEDTALIAAAEAGQLAFATGDYSLFTLRLSDAMRTSSNLEEAFYKAREKTVEESRGICQELKRDKSKQACKVQGPTLDDPLDIVRMFELEN